MTLPQPAELLPSLLNLPDLLLLLFLLVSLIFGLRHGCVHVLYGLVGKIAALAAALFVARTCAPILAEYLVTPIIGDIFESRATNFQLYTKVLEGLRQTVTQAATSMAESVAFLTLLILFTLIFAFAIRLLGKLLHFLSDRTPLGVLDSLGGGLLGLLSGVVLLVLILLIVQWVSPITYSPLGFLSPERIHSTVLLRFLIDRLPVAI